MVIDTLQRGRLMADEFEMDSQFADNPICENTACSCPVVEAGTFCSDHCRGSASEAAESPCDCGHSSCTADALFEIVIE